MHGRLGFLLGLSIAVGVAPGVVEAASWAYIPKRKVPAEQHRIYPPSPPPQAAPRPLQPPLSEPAYPEMAPVVQPVRMLQPAPKTVAAPAPPPLKPLPKTLWVQPRRFDEEGGLTFEVRSGLRLDHLQWNIASDITGTATPNVLSELRWEDVAGYEVSPRIRYLDRRWLKGLYLEGEISRHYTVAGSNQDSDWAGDNRTAEFSRSNNESDTGRGGGFSAGIGYAFDFGSARSDSGLRLLTLIGYARRQQDFIMTDGFQTIPATGPFAGLHSTYKAEWRAPYAGLGVLWRTAAAHRFNFFGKYYRGKYEAEADWNLRPEFRHPTSYTHEANGQGYSLALEYGWMFYPNLELTLLGEYTHIKTQPGLDVTYFDDGTVVSTRLNDAEWNTQRYMAGLGYTF